MIYQGDCLDILKGLKENSIDSLVTDPPGGISFMGKSWDDDKGGRDNWIKWLSEVMQECMRVMKPGAHGLVWAIPRTSHWTATALEDAGFEIRDVVTHLFGSGFPKSLDVSKAIDKAAGVEREILSTRVKNTGTHYYENGSKMGRANYGVKQGDVKIKYENIELPITIPSTHEAKQWQGWGTALKPATEHWILIRKPCSEKTVAKNVLKWGTGAINIDESRIQTCHKLTRPSTSMDPRTQFQSKNRVPIGEIGSTNGRFPANLILSCVCESAEHGQLCAVHLLDEQAEIEASRFFYCAKVSSSERGDSTHPTMKSKKLMSYLIKLITPSNGTVLDPFMGSGSTGLAAKENGFEFIGIEKEKEYYEIAEKRIGQGAGL